MTEEAAKQSKKQPRRDRVNLDPVSLARLQSWLDQFNQNFPTGKITRSDLINYLLSSRSESLSENELAGLRERFFDEVQLAEWALRELKAARNRGENSTLNEILDSLKIARPVSRKKRTKSAPQIHTENSEGQKQEN
jgi:hypothetical protein